MNVLFVDSTHLKKLNDSDEPTKVRWNRFMARTESDKTKCDLLASVYVLPCDLSIKIHLWLANLALC